MIAGQAGKKILVPPQFPVGLAQALREFCTVSVDSGTVLSMRAKKTKDRNLRAMRHVQKVTETAMGLAVALIRKSIGKKGSPLRQWQAPDCGTGEVHHALPPATAWLHRGGHDRLVRGGHRDPPHDRHRPLRADEPIIIDLFPVEEKSGYYADMTRTVVKGEPSHEIREMYDTLREAKQLADLARETESPGMRTFTRLSSTSSRSADTRAIRGGLCTISGTAWGSRSTSFPTVGPAGKALAAGNVITIEPGLYYPGTGGVRLEDIGVVTKHGL